MLKVRSRSSHATSRARKRTSKSLRRAIVEEKEREEPIVGAMQKNQGYLLAASNPLEERRERFADKTVPPLPTRSFELYARRGATKYVSDPEEKLRLAMSRAPRPCDSLAEARVFYEPPQSRPPARPVSIFRAKSGKFRFFLSRLRAPNSKFRETFANFLRISHTHSHLLGRLRPHGTIASSAQCAPWCAPWCGEESRLL